MSAPIEPALRGRFITLEGIDGAGKSSQIDALASRLAAAGRPVTRTREPGGTPLAEQLRELVLRQGMDAMTETLLVFAARRDHLRQVIAPALGRGETVLCDRYTDATFAYQGGGRGADFALLATLEATVQDGVQPDLTLWFDLPAATAAARRAAARAEALRQGDRFEAEDAGFFERVAAAYRARAEAAPERIVRIDASVGRDAVWQQITAVLEARRW